MKTRQLSLFIFYISLMFTSCAQKEVPLEQLVERDQLMYEVNSNSPFTGLAVNKFPNEQYHLKSPYSKGKKDGETIEYYQNGQIKIQIPFTDGLLNGRYEEYYEDGKPKIMASYANGKKNGTYQEYYETGKPKLNFNFRDDNLVGRYEKYRKNETTEIEYTLKEGGGFIGDYIEYNEDGSVKKHVWYDENQQTKNKGAWKRHWTFEYKWVDKPADFYDIVTFDDTGKPSGEVKGYYTKSDKPYYQGTYSSIDPDIREGKFEWLFEDGTPKLIGTYVNNKKNGILESYFRENNYTGTSRLRERIEYKDDKFNGHFEKYNANDKMGALSLASYEKNVGMGWPAAWWKIEGNCVNGKYDGTFKVWLRYQHTLERNAYNIDAYMKHIWSNGDLISNGYDKKIGGIVYYDGATGQRLEGGMLGALIRKAKGQ